MAWAERGEKDREAFNKYVESVSPATNAWDRVPGLRVEIDCERTDAAMRKAEREGAPERLAEASGDDPPIE